MGMNSTFVVARRARTTGKKGQGIATRIRMDLDLYLMIVPPVIVAIVFSYIPMVWTAIAFQDFNLFEGLLGSGWVGLKNFKDVLASHDFLLVLRNTVWLNFIRIVINFPQPILLALLLNEVRSRFFKRAVQTVGYVPHFLSWVIVSGIFLSLLMSDGPVNRALSAIGLPKAMFLTDPRWFRPINIIQGSWKEVGFSAVIYIAAIAGVDPQLYEAARMDGAGRLRQAWHVTLPSIASTIVVLLLIRIAYMVASAHYMEQILTMYNPAVYETADVIGTYVYRNGLGRMQYSYSAAMDLISSVTGCVLVFLGNRMSGRLTGRSIW